MKAPAFRVLSRPNYYLSVFRACLRLALALLSAYRLNALVHSLYGFTFILGVYFGINVAFNHTPTIGGFNRDEVILMYLTSLTLWAFLEAVSFEGFVTFMGRDIATGEFDFFLLKPIVPQVLIAMARPNLRAFLYLFVMAGLLIWHGWSFFAAASLTQLFGYLGLWLIGWLIHLNIVSLYATLGFFLTKSVEILRLVQSLGDQSFYPTLIYPGFIQVVLLSFLPAALAAYLPVSVLLGRAEPIYLWSLVITVPAIILLNSLAWHFSLKRYSSASS